MDDAGERTGPRAATAGRMRPLTPRDLRCSPQPLVPREEVVVLRCAGGGGADTSSMTIGTTILGTTNPVGTHCAEELRRLDVSERATVATLVVELHLTKAEAKAAVRAADAHLDRRARGTHRSG